MRTYISIHITLLGICLLTFVSCKKETEYAPYPYNDIQSLKITAADETISAALVGDSIVIYWPSYLDMPEKISPQITVSENATVTPASGTEVDFATGTKFSVKAQSGAVKDYFLKIVINQPPIQLAQETYITYLAEKGGTCTFTNGVYLRYVIPDPAVTRFYLIDSSDTEHELAIAFTEETQDLVVTVPDEDQFGMGGYRIRIVSGTQTLETADHIFGIVYPSSMKGTADALTTSVTVKRGEEITFSGANFFDMKEAIVMTYDANGNESELGTLELVSYTAASATYRVPAGFPTGTRTMGTWAAGSVNIALRTSDYIGNWSWSAATKVTIPVNAPFDGSVSFTVTE
ncbi:hypothetical protein [Chitinophaga sp. XS-30]|uniref:hypothetical protein n=1 Tax=Chitinophaga sp. XS-30 TaxID=2604421 RepID=UPI0011DE0DC7|nr:hypothetical protein [Chitinophaga sp. XS-30]QEH43733.1 hypothetical protein FW415_23895 [Chitinophaga sp. XS-30]